MLHRTSSLQTPFIMPPRKRNTKRPKRLRKRKGGKLVQSTANSLASRIIQQDDMAKVQVASQLALCYGNPFDHLPPKISATAIPYTTLNRGSFTSTTGHCMIVLSPNSTLYAVTYHPSITNTSTTFSASSVGVPWQEASTITANFNAARVLAGAIRYSAGVASTAASGISICGMAYGSLAGFVTNTIASLLVNPHSKVDTTDGGGMVSLRPIGQGLGNEEFSSNGVSTDAQSVNGPQASIVITGLPANTSVFWEAVVHWEGLTNQGSLAQMLQGIEFGAPEIELDAVNSLASRMAPEPISNRAGFGSHKLGRLPLAPVLGQNYHDEKSSPSSDYIGTLTGLATAGMVGHQAWTAFRR